MKPNEMNEEIITGIWVCEDQNKNVIFFKDRTLGVKSFVFNDDLQLEFISLFINTSYGNALLE